jgi:hypothetical protein
MNMSETHHTQRRRVRPPALVALVAALVMLPSAFEAQLDICGCATIPDLPVADSTTGTYPPGWVDTGTNGSLTIPMPADGIIRLASLFIQNKHVVFSRNASNTPVTILVAGNVTLRGTGCCYTLNVSGAPGSSGSSSTAGVGGQGGPGGFRGGDGAALPINLASVGGAGFGPGGGAGGTPASLADAGPGILMGVPELIPLIGGSGGGGGGSASATPTSCSGGGGGGGGGAILIAANGTLTLQDYQIFADGGGGGNRANGTCSSSGGDGSAGAVRLVASRFAGAGTAQVFARTGGSTATGRIRLESIDTSSQTIFSTAPAAQRITGPTPLMNPVAPSVMITSIGGNSVPAEPQGTFGAIDIVLSAPGAIGVSLATAGVPGGTTLEVTVKPRIGGLPQTQTVPLTGCDSLGACQANASFNLPAGAYVFEARATFQLQGQ